jgi:hypothetical protein
MLDIDDSTAVLVKAEVGIEPPLKLVMFFTGSV